MGGENGFAGVIQSLMCVQNGTAHRCEETAFCGRSAKERNLLDAQDRQSACLVAGLCKRLKIACKTKALSANVFGV